MSSGCKELKLPKEKIYDKKNFFCLNDYNKLLNKFSLFNDQNYHHYYKV